MASKAVVVLAHVQGCAQEVIDWKWEAGQACINSHWTDLLLIGWLTKEGEIYLCEVCVQQEPEEFACRVHIQPGSEPQQHGRFDCTCAG